MGRGNCGEDEGSKAGSRDGAGRFTPATGESGRGTWLGEEPILVHMSWVLMQGREKDVPFDIGISMLTHTS